MFTQISFIEFSKATQGGVCVRGGQMLDGGSYMEYVDNLEVNRQLYRYEVTCDGLESWYVFKPSC